MLKLAALLALNPPLVCPGASWSPACPSPCLPGSRGGGQTGWCPPPTPSQTLMLLPPPRAENGANKVQEAGAKLEQRGL